MGEHAQKRLVRKLDLELFLSKIRPQPNPQAHLEQYTISESIAANLLYIAAYTNNDIIGKSVLDLGCGTGRLALGAAFLGAKNVLGVDISKLAVQTALENSRAVGFKRAVQWVNGDISVIVGMFDTILQNPPFGVQKRTADRAFLEKALDVGGSIYSLHNHPEADKQLIKRLKASGGFLRVSPSSFLEKFVEQRHGTIKGVYSMFMTIPTMFDFHKKTKHYIVVDLYVIVKKV